MKDNDKIIHKVKHKSRKMNELRCDEERGRKLIENWKRFIAKCIDLTLDMT